jgi:2-oxoglutarate/2-oxoacid ferredoxin oxidoreductase subunit beta
VAETTLTKKDFTPSQDVRWCPGCGDFAILAAVQKVLPELGVPPHNVVFFSGIGCSGRFPYYVHTYGFHGIHGRAPAFATGMKIARPELSVWVATGDGDALSIGGNHIIHILRRNVDVNILMFNNRIYGLTKGQYSPTSEIGKKTKTSPMGSLDRPFNPISLTLGAGATFVARALDADVKNLSGTVRAAALHKGTSFVEVYQNCVVYNDGAWDSLENKETRPDHVVYLEHGKPLVFGKERTKGIRMNGVRPEVVTIGENGITEADLIIHDEEAQDPFYCFMLSQMLPPNFPTPIGIFRKLQRPSYDELVHNQIAAAKQKAGEGTLQKLLHSGETWKVGA